MRNVFIAATVLVCSILSCQAQEKPNFADESSRDANWSKGYHVGLMCQEAVQYKQKVLNIISTSQNSNMTDLNRKILGTADAQVVLVCAENERREANAMKAK